MTSPSHRPFALAAAAAGLCWTTFGIAAVASPAPADRARVVLTETGDYLGFGLFTLSLVLTVVALLGLHAHHRGADGRLGRAGTLVAMTGCAAQAVVIGTILVTGEEPSWFGIAAPVAILTWFAGSVAFGVAIRRAGILPRWAGVVLPIVTLFAIVGSEVGTSVLIGAFLLYTATRLRRRGSPARATALPRTA